MRSIYSIISAGVLLLLAGNVALAQNGRISGVVTDKETGEPIPFASILVKQGDLQKAGVAADINGKFSVYPLRPGTYEVTITSLGYQKKVMQGVIVNFETTTRLNTDLNQEGQMLDAVVIEEYRVPLVDFDNTSTGSKLTAKDIEKMPTRSVSAVATQTAGVFSSDDGAGLNIRGGRTGDNAYFVNGVRVYGTSLPPVEAIAEMSVITGGVPAQYGDLLGGVINITTKGPSPRFNGGVQYETSRPFDGYNYDLLSANFSGPLLRKGKKDTSMTKAQNQKRPPILGYFVNVQYSGSRENDPSAYGYYKAKDHVLADMKENPYRLFGESYRSVADFFGPEHIERVDYRPNTDDHSISLNATFDFQPFKNTTIAVGGNGGYARSMGGSNPSDFNLFNHENQNLVTGYDYNIFGRLRQTFSNDFTDTTQSFIRNIYYQIQFDYSRSADESRDPNHQKNLWRYNHAGFFEQDYYDLDLRSVSAASPMANFVQRDPLTGDSLGAVNFRNTNSKHYVVKDVMAGPIRFTPGPYNPDLGKINNFLLGRENFFNPFDLVASGGAYNGAGIPRSAGYFFTMPGQGPFGYSISTQEQFRFTAQAGAEVGNHTVKVGFEYEQRVDRAWFGSGNLFLRGNQLLNQHLYPVYSGATLAYDTTYSGTDTTIFVTPNPVVIGGQLNPTNQSDFDRNLRAKFNIPLNEEINIDAIHPDDLELGLFSKDEMFGDGINGLASWQGYDPYGKVAERSNFRDFFYDTLNRPVDAYRPIYLAGYIEDKFEIKDFILRLGLRIDRFDLNQPVLKDPQSLTRLSSVGELDLTRFNRGQFDPSSAIQDDWVVYVDRPVGSTGDPNTYDIVGFRSGDVWYDETGAEISNPGQLERNGNLNPWFDNTRLSPFERGLQEDNKLTLDAFEDFKPQTNFLPRVSFSFPISMDAGFFAHYDVLTRRPTAAQRGIVTGNSGVAEVDPFASPLTYYLMSRSIDPFLINPDLDPQRTIDYELGFRQRLSRSSALTISAFYREIKDLIQVVQYQYAYPAAYTTVDNQDFAVIKGLELGYDLRRTNNVRITANYTLQFAEGSASDIASELVRTGSPALRIAVPLSYDQRHAFKATIDYRIDHGDGPKILGIPIFQDMGFNTTWVTGSGTPYTAWGNNWGARERQIKGQINGARLPWNNRTSLRVDKTFYLKSGKNRHVLNVYCYVQNLFDARNVINVHPRTGDPKDDGFLTSDFGKQTTQQQPSPETYAYFYSLLVADPDNVSLPRRFRIGLSYRF